MFARRLQQSLRGHASRTFSSTSSTFSASSSVSSSVRRVVAASSSSSFAARLIGGCVVGCIVGSHLSSVAYAQQAQSEQSSQEKSEDKQNQANAAQSVAPTKSAEEEAEDAAYEEWKKEQEAGYSAPINPDSGRPFVRNIVANEITQLIENRDSDVLLQIYAPWCGACKMMHPIVDQLAKVMHEVEEETAASSSSSSSASTSSPHKLVIYQMDGDANLLPGFLTPEENRALPLVKFFPACGSAREPREIREKPECESVVYKGRPNVQNMIDFVYEQMKKQETALPAVHVPAIAVSSKSASSPSTSSASSSPSSISSAEPFSLARAHSIGRRLEPETHVLVEQALTARFAKDSEESPSLKLHEIAPCGQHLTKLMNRFVLSGYTSYIPSLAIDEAEGKALFDTYRECTDREETKLEEFWLQVKKQTDEALENLEQKRANRAKEEEMKKQQEVEEKRQQEENKATHAAAPSTSAKSA